MSLRRNLRRFKPPSRGRLITTPIFYVNAAPHLGHAYTMVLSDALTRWHRTVEGCPNTYLSSGTDEHGLKVYEAALKMQTNTNETDTTQTEQRSSETEQQSYSQQSSSTVKKYCDKTSANFRNLANSLNIKFDDFIRTTETRHRNTVHEMWNKIKDSPESPIRLGHHEGWYHTSDECFVTEAQRESMNEQEQSGLKWVKEENYIFDLPKFYPHLQKYLSKETIKPSFRNQEMLLWIKERMEEPTSRGLSVSRLFSRVPWAIPVPKDESHGVYVWLDALSNYLTVMQNLFKGNLLSSLPSDDDSRLPADLIHVVGKDIIRFHSIYWPAFLTASGYQDLPKKIIAHGHWTMNQAKMSKSLGNVVNTEPLVEMFGIDFVRFYILRDGPLHLDVSFDQALLTRRINSDLVNTLGNLISRATSKSLMEDDTIIKNPFGNSIEALSFLERTVEPEEAKRFCNDLFDGHLPTSVQNLIEEEANFPRAIERVMRVLYDANMILQHVEPWKQEVKDSGDADKAIYLSLEAARQALLLLRPVIPDSSDELLRQMGCDDEEENTLMQWEDENSKKWVGFPQAKEFGNWPDDVKENSGKKSRIAFFKRIKT